MSLLILILLAVILFTILIFIKFVRTWIKYKDVDCLPGPKKVPFLGNLLDLGSDLVETHKNICEFPKKYGELMRIWFGPFQPSLMVGKPEHIEYFLSSNVHITKSPGYDYIKLFIGNGLITSTGDYWRRHRRMITPTFHFKILEQFLVFTNANVNTLIGKMKHKVDKEIDIYPLIQMFALDTILQMTEALKVLKNFTDNIIKTRREERKKMTPSTSPTNEDQANNEMGIKKRVAFLDLLLDIAENNYLTDDEIREEVDTFVFAGHDTISSTLSFTLFELARHPQIQQRIFEESLAVMGSDINVEMSYSFLQEFKYLEMVIKEVLRMHATVPILQRILTVDAEFDGYKIPAGTQVFITVQSTHHNPKYYPNPEKFDPERFSPENSVNRHPFAFIPFSAGPRNCIGQKFAMMEMKVVLTNIVRNFHIKAVVPEHKLILGSDAVLKSVNGIPMVLTLRKNS